MNKLKKITISILLFIIYVNLYICIFAEDISDGPTVYYNFDKENVVLSKETYIFKDLSGNKYDATSAETTIFTGTECINDILKTNQAIKGAIKIPNEAFKNVNTSYTINFIGQYIWQLRPINLIDFGDCCYTSAWGSGMGRQASYFENAEYVGFQLINVPKNINMYTFICNEGQIKMYINSEEIKSKYYDKTASVILSQTAQNVENEFIVQNLYLDEFRLYNRALTDKEIQKLYKDIEHLIVALNQTPTIEPTIIPTEAPVVTIEPTVVPTDEPKTEISLNIDDISDDGAVNCTIYNNTNEDITSDCIVAVYDSKEELQGIKVVNGVPQGNISLKVENCNDASMIKVFLWDSLTGMKPQIERLVYSV